MRGKHYAIEHQGKLLTLKELSKAVNVPYPTISGRWQRGDPVVSDWCVGAIRSFRELDDGKRCSPKSRKSSLLRAYVHPV